MNKEVKELRKKFKKYGIDGYVVPKNDDYFTEYSKINRLKIISNFSGSAGLAVILKNKNYLFTDGRYTIQSQIESGKNFKIISYDNYSTGRKENQIKDKRVKFVEGVNGPANEGRLCVKGRFGFDYIHHEHRLNKPLIRRIDAPRKA